MQNSPKSAEWRWAVKGRLADIVACVIILVGVCQSGGHLAKWPEQLLLVLLLLLSRFDSLQNRCLSH